MSRSAGRISLLTVAMLYRSFSLGVAPRSWRAASSLRRGPLLRRARSSSAVGSAGGAGPDGDADRAEAEILRLADEIYRHDQLYYEAAAPAISDEEYDALVRAATSLEERYPQFVPPHSRSRRIGYANKLSAAEGGFLSVPHQERMLSLDNAFTTEDIQQFIDRLRRSLPPPSPGDAGAVPEARSSEDEGGARPERSSGYAWNLEFVCEPKVDGLSLSLRYEGGVLQQALTRGDGQVGEDITANALRVQSIPKALPGGAPDALEVRGEVYCPLGEYDAYAAQCLSSNATAPSSPRNLAAGAIRQQDAREVSNRPLAFCAYAADASGDSGLFATQREALSLLSSYGFTTSESLFPAGDGAAERSAEAMRAYAARVEASRERGDLDFPCDGCVFKLNDLRLSGLAGATARAPRSAVAFKFAATRAVTRLLGVEVGVGRTGMLTPRAVLEPVEIGGAVVQSATLHNYALLRKRDLRVGDLVAVERAGDVIPKVLGVAVEGEGARGDRISAPERCPSCGSAVSADDGSGGDADASEGSGAQLRCSASSLDCPGQRLEQLVYLCGRSAFDLAGFGRKTLTFLYEEGYVQDVLQLLAFPEDEASRVRLGGEGGALEPLRNRTGFGDVSVSKMEAAVRRRREDPMSLSEFIQALSIRNVGRSQADNIAAAFPSVGAFLAGLEALARSDGEPEGAWDGVEGMGRLTALRLKGFASDPRMMELAAKLAAALNVRDGPSGDSDAAAAAADGRDLPLAGLSVVFSGTLELSGWTRQQAKAVAAQCGASKTPAGLSKSVDLFVVGRAPGKAKLDKAASLQVEVIEEADFLRRIGRADEFDLDPAPELK